MEIESCVASAVAFMRDNAPAPSAEDMAKARRKTLLHAIDMLQGMQGGLIRLACQSLISMPEGPAADAVRRDFRAGVESVQELADELGARLAAEGTGA